MNIEPLNIEQAQIVANARDLEVLLDNREIRRMNDMWVDVLGNMFQQFYRKTLSAIVPGKAVIHSMPFGLNDNNRFIVFGI